MNQYYKSIPSEQMSDFEDFYLRMADALPDEARVCEIGLADGRSIILLASAMKSRKKRCTIFGIDSMDYGKGDQATTIINNIIRSGEDTIQIIQSTSLDASCRFQDNELDMVFIDSSHQYAQTVAEIRLWLHKVKPGGILAGHDYTGIDGVRKAVDECLVDGVESVPTAYDHGVWCYVKPL